MLANRVDGTLKKVEGERARQLAEGIAGKHF
jgi:hypothetical protein